MKKRSEIWRDTINAVTDITEISQREIFSGSKKADISQARSLFFLVLNNSGFRPATILRMCKTNGWESIVHSTVLKNIQRAKAQKSEQFHEFLSEIESSISSSTEG